MRCIGQWPIAGRHVVKLVTFEPTPRSVPRTDRRPITSRTCLKASCEATSFSFYSVVKGVGLYGQRFYVLEILEILQRVTELPSDSAR